ncbi:MAG: type II toxin-antitoxin system prevent-host-death family antitoxin [Blastocatellia bacterium]|nr:type II toxin-antitoxin system prevent-host-death family antitoxin [Blastocatellia bacterium]
MSFYVAKVKRGEEIIISERGVPFAKIVPFKTAAVSGHDVGRRRESKIRSL